LSFHLPKSLPTITINDWKPSCEIAYQDFRAGHLNLELCPHECYDEVVESGFCDPDLFIQFLESARTRLVSIVRDQKSRANVSGDKLLGEQCDRRLQELEQTGCQDQEIVRTARRLALLRVFEEAQKLQFKNLYRMESEA
jgi:hypothetical protein